MSLNIRVEQPLKTFRIRLPVPLIERLENFVSFQQADTPEATKHAIFEAIVEDALKRHGGKEFRKYEENLSAMDDEDRAELLGDAASKSAVAAIDDLPPISAAAE